MLRKVTSVALFKLTTMRKLRTINSIFRIDIALKNRLLVSVEECIIGIYFDKQATLTNKVTNESAVEVGNPLHATGRVNSAGNFSVGLFLIVVVSQHETQQQAWHDDVTDAQHGKVTAGGAGEHQFAGE